MAKSACTYLLRLMAKRAKLTEQQAPMPGLSSIGTAAEGAMSALPHKAPPAPIPGMSLSRPSPTMARPKPKATKLPAPAMGAQAGTLDAETSN